MRSIRRIALAMVADRPGHHRITLGPDKAYDEAGFVAELHEYNVTPHVAQNTTNRRSAIDGRTTRHPGYAVSGRMRKRIEELLGWTKGATGFRKTHHHGLARVGWMFTLTATSYNLFACPSLWRSLPNHVRKLSRHGNTNKIDTTFCVLSPYSTTYEGSSHHGSTFCSAVTEFSAPLLKGWSPLVRLSSGRQVVQEIIAKRPLRLPG